MLAHLLVLRRALALPSSPVTIDRSSNSKQSSIDLARRYATVATSVATRRDRGCRRSLGAVAVIP
jgi:hypothetical protein